MIKTELLKKINETYFRNYQSTDLFPLSTSSTQEDLEKYSSIMSHLEHIKGYDF